MINVCCVYYGNKYKQEYVQKLYNMVERHLTIPHKFYCFTDWKSLPRQIKGDIIYKEFPRHDMDGWWNKLQLFHPDVELDGVNLYMDLDVVIVDNIDCFVTHSKNEEFSIIRDFGQPDTTYNSSIMKWNNSTATSLIWEPYFKDRPKWRKVQGDQNVVTDLMKGKEVLKPFPDEWTQSYKWLDRTKTRFSKSKWTFELSKTAKIAVFHGKPNPHESDQDWVKNNWK